MVSATSGNGAAGSARAPSEGQAPPGDRTASPGPAGAERGMRKARGPLALCLQSQQRGLRAQLWSVGGDSLRGLAPTCAPRSRADARRKAISLERPPGKARGSGPGPHPSTKALGQLRPSGHLILSEWGEAGLGHLRGSRVWPWLGLEGEGLSGRSRGHPRPREGPDVKSSSLTLCHPDTRTANRKPSAWGAPGVFWDVSTGRPCPRRPMRRDKAVSGFLVREGPGGATRLPEGHLQAPYE